MRLKLFKNFYFRRYVAANGAEAGLKLFKNFYFRRSFKAQSGLAG